MRAVVLAGGPPDAVSALYRGAVNKAFVPVAGIAMVQRVIAALRASAAIDCIIAVAPVSMHESDALAGADERRTDGARMIESLDSGLAGAPPDEPVLVVASDLPVLTPAAVEELIALAAARNLDIGYAIVDSHVHYAAFPGFPHTWATMYEGRFCGGGAVVLRPRVLSALRGVMDDLGAARKSPLRLATLFGWDIAPRFALGFLRIAAAEDRAGTILRAPVGAVRCTHAEIALNVDRPGDVGLANELVTAAAKTSQ